VSSAGIVAAAARTNGRDSRYISPSRDETPTLPRRQSPVAQRSVRRQQLTAALGDGSGSSYIPDVTSISQQHYRSSVATPQPRDAVSPRRRATTSSPHRATNGVAVAGGSVVTSPPKYGRGTSGIGAVRTLHVMCADGDAEGALHLLRAQPSLVNDIDDACNTPLHCACASPVVSIELINALLLGGGSLTVKNEDGLAAFHLAVLNTADHAAHALKKFLIFKAAVNPNLRTSRGETAAHLCASNDRHLASLQFLTTTGLDLNVAALLQVQGGDAVSPKRGTARDKARLCGAAASRCRALLDQVEA
jgi:hypothetical protein